MKPQHHFVFAVASVYALTEAFSLKPPIDSFLLLALAGIVGTLPDFEHRENILKIVSIAVAASSYPLLSKWWEQSFSGDYLAVFIPAAISLALGYTFYKTKPFWKETKQHLKKMKAEGKETTNYGAHLAFGILFFMLITLLTSIEIGFLLFIAYSSHAILDMARYDTKFGKTVLAWIQEKT